MATTFTRTTFAIAIAAPALLFLGAAITQALSDVSAPGGVAIVNGFDPQPEPPRISAAD
jgi:hypothetical protein